MRDDVVRIGRLLMDDQLGEAVLNLGHAQRDAGRAGRRPFFRCICRVRIAARTACAQSVR
jgi:hypothetical protein